MRPIQRNTEAPEEGLGPPHQLGKGHRGRLTKRPCRDGEESGQPVAALQRQDFRRCVRVKSAKSGARIGCCALLQIVVCSSESGCKGQLRSPSCCSTRVAELWPTVADFLSLLGMSGFVSSHVTEDEFRLYTNRSRPGNPWFFVLVATFFTQLSSPLPFVCCASWVVQDIRVPQLVAGLNV